MEINWYPGHMARAERELKEAVAQIDVLVEMVDARIPTCSDNPRLKKLAGNRPVIILINKTDLADPIMTIRWIAYFSAKGYRCAAINAEKGEGIGKTRELIREAASARIAADTRKGRRPDRPVRVMITGIPNVGKSSLINRISGKAGAPVGDRPGVTRGWKWVRSGQGIEVMDTPGILMPRITERTAGYKLAWTGAIRDEILDVETLAGSLLVWTGTHYPASLAERYPATAESPRDGTPVAENADPSDLADPAEGAARYGNTLLQVIARTRGYLLPGGVTDTTRCAVQVLDDFRAGKIGRMTLDEIPHGSHGQ